MLVWLHFQVECICHSITFLHIQSCFEPSWIQTVLSPPNFAVISQKFLQLTTLFSSWKMVIRRLGPLVHLDVNVLHSQSFLSCFPLPRNFWKSIYSVHVPFASGPYLCSYNLKRSRSWVTPTLVVLSLIVKTQTEALSPMNGTFC